MAADGEGAEETDEAEEAEESEEGLEAGVELEAERTEEALDLVISNR